jgi:hypothetical protein
MGHRWEVYSWQVTIAPCRYGYVLRYQGSKALKALLVVCWLKWHDKVKCVKVEWR